jgi:hypothetical protein
MQKGWIMALSESPRSSWGNVEEFYEGVRPPRRKESWQIQSEVWGKTLRKNWILEANDGIAFYHTKKAGFPKGDPWHRKARISLIAEILDVAQAGQQVNYLSVRIRKANFDSLRKDPILREQSTEHLFQAAGMIQGTVATFYLLPPTVWEEIALRVRRPSVNSHVPLELGESEEEISAEEGAQRLQLHLIRERDSRLVRLKKQQVLESGARLACEICGFNFEDRYGSHGRGICEVHHRIPLSSRLDESHSRLEDLAIVCANCHRMLHQSAELCSISVVRSLLR